jgi:hypothetical protein
MERARLRLPTIPLPRIASARRLQNMPASAGPGVRVQRAQDTEILTAFDDIQLVAAGS